MIIELKPEHQRMIEVAVGSGVYRDSGEVLDQALEMVIEQLESEDWLAIQRETIAAHIEKSFGQALRGELVDGDEAIATLRNRRNLGSRL